MEAMENNLDTVKKLMEHRDQDWLHINIGQEGSGKSTLGLRMAQYFDDDFDVDNIVFTPDQFISRSKKLEQYSAIVVDEGANVFYSRDAMTKGVKKAVKFLTQMRELNLFIIINIPNFFIIDKYIREHRTKSMSRAIKPGWFHFYSKRRMDDIERKNGGINYPDPVFRDTWDKMEGELWDNYIEKKHRTIKDDKTEDFDSELLSTGKFAKLVGVTSNTIKNWYRDGKIRGVTLSNGHIKIPKSEREKVIENSTL